MGGEWVAGGALDAVDQAVVAEQAGQAADFSGVAADVSGGRLLAEQGFAEVAIAEAVQGEFAAQQVPGQWRVGPDERWQAAAAVAVVGDGWGQLIEDMARGCGGLDTRQSDCGSSAFICVHLRLICGLPTPGVLPASVTCPSQPWEQSASREAAKKTGRQHPPRLLVRHSESQNRITQPSRRRVVDQPSHGECRELPTFVMHTLRHSLRGPVRDDK